MQTEMRLFYEEQKMSAVLWVMLLVYGIAGMMWWGFVEQIVLGRPWGSRPAPDGVMWLFWLAFGIGLPVFFHLLRLIVEVYPDEVVIRYVMLTTRRIPITDIRTFEARTYRPLREFGGWGIRGWSDRRAYSVQGNQGVALTLHDGKVVMIGSQKPQALEQALAEAVGLRS